MVLEYYNLREQPFGVTPDARFLYLSPTHREALASLLYGISAGRGFVALIAKPGMGKTTLLFQSLEQLQATAETVFLFQTISTPLDFLRALLTDLGLDVVGGDLIELQAKLNHFLLEQSRSGKRLIIFIDEAQNLDGLVFELVRMLSNFETPREKLMQIVLCGQPQLAEKLASADLEQLRQRVSMIAQLKPFSLEETKLYMEHRLRVAGYSAEKPLFTSSALTLIAARSGGIPRNINNLCFNALSLGCALKRKTIDTDIVLEVLGDLDLNALREQSPASVEPALKAAPAVPRFEPSRAETGTGPSRILRFGIAAIVLVALGWMLARVPTGGRKHFEVQASTLPANDAPSNQVASSEAPASVIPASVVPLPVPAGKFQDALVSAPSPAALFGAIRVTPGDTLYRICREQFTTCSPNDVQRILRLNPRLKDPDHIEPGERIRIPVVLQPSGASQSIVEQAGSTSSAERGTQ